VSQALSSRQKLGRLRPLLTLRPDCRIAMQGGASVRDQSPVRDVPGVPNTVAAAVASIYSTLRLLDQQLRGYLGFLGRRHKLL